MTWPALAPWCVLADVGGTPVVFDQRSGTLLALDDVAAFVLRHREHFGDLAEATEALAETFEVDATLVAHDLQRLARRVKALGRAKDRPVPTVGRRAHPASPGQPTTWRIDALGRALEVTCHDRELSDVIAPLLAAHRNSQDDPTHRFDVWVDGPGITVTQDGAVTHERVPIPDAIGGLLTGITAVTMFDRRPLPLVHAAAVACGDAVIVVGGGSNQGKSTTTIELMLRGFGYLSDEIVELDPASGRVTGLARPIGLEGPMRARWPQLRPSWLDGDDPAPRWPVAPTLVGDVAEAGTLRLFVVLEFTNAEASRVDSLDVLEAVATVGTLTYNRGCIAEATLVQLGELFGHVPAVRVQHDGAETAAGAVLDVCEQLVDRAVE